MLRPPGIAPVRTAGSKEPSEQGAPGHQAPSLSGVQEAADSICPALSEDKELSRLVCLQKTEIVLYF